MPLAQEILQMLRAHGEQSLADLMRATRRTTRQVRWALAFLERDSLVASVRRRTDGAQLYFAVAHLDQTHLH